ncbi:hypothetical protein [Flavobacterium sp.]|uniref:hypothetical protein n=1 Tax=Flavobacterium sp. TaxID=239 RepID=UPI00122201F3|nr:hypothetical protein [Flavobacterium sp.]RZJ71054.1 MAG: hypothetical protein EOO49_11410 [Flavobacterium sp.]
MNGQIGQSKNKLTLSDYVVGLFGLIPILGLLLGIILVDDGKKRNLKGLKIIGSINIGATMLFVLIGIPLLFNSQAVRESEKKLTVYLLNEIVKDLEYYKQHNGGFPESLNELKKQNAMFIDEEVIKEAGIFAKQKHIKFYYKKENGSYVLKSYGIDRILNTDDDIYPALK